jgi:ferredoxin
MPDDSSEISIDRERCMGSGACIAQAPATFAHDAEPKAILLPPPHDPIEAVLAAIDACPMSALAIAGVE